MLVSDLRATIRELRAKAGQGHGQGAGEIRASRFDSPSATLDSLSAAVFDLRALRTQPPSSSAAGGAAYTKPSARLDPAPAALPTSATCSAAEGLCAAPLLAVGNGCALGQHSAFARCWFPRAAACAPVSPPPARASHPQTAYSRLPAAAARLILARC